MFTALKKAAICLALAGTITGCISFIADTPEQRLYAAVADVRTAVAGSADYCERPDASTARCVDLLNLAVQAQTLLAVIETGVVNGTIDSAQASDLLRILADLLDSIAAPQSGAVESDQL